MPNKTQFVGRKSELRKLTALSAKQVASLVVVRGRRRIGKSRLIMEFAKGKKLIKFSGLAPEKGMTAKDQRENFVDQLLMQFNGPRLATDNWNYLFYVLAEILGDQECILLFDEISWMAHDDPTFLSKLKDFWDNCSLENPRLIVVFCSSVSSWVDENIIASKAFYGRVSSLITLGELSLSELRKLMDVCGIKGSPMELLSILSITGGVPWYVELFEPNTPASTNIKKLCFSKDGVLVNEFSRIFGELFSRRAQVYRNIVLSLVNKRRTQQELSNKLGYSNSGYLSKYLNDLLVAGFIKKDSPWSLDSNRIGKLAKWRLSDNYLRFYLKYIEPRLAKIQNGSFDDDFSVMENFSSIMGLQFENLVLNNRKLIIEKLQIDKSQIVFDNPYFQTKTKARQGCQIDYLVQTKLNALLACEIKFSKNEIGMSVIEEMEKKLKRLVKPRGFSCFPVLIHVNGVTEELEDSRYFYKIIDFSEFLKS